MNDFDFELSSFEDVLGLFQQATARRMWVDLEVWTV